MLMMSRREGEVILIGEQIEIVIAHIGRSRVKVGIRAPREMPVLAHEVKLVKDENRAAAKMGVGAELGSILKKMIQMPQSSRSAVEERINRQEAGH